MNHKFYYESIIFQYRTKITDYNLNWKNFSFEFIGRFLRIISYHNEIII